MDNGKRAGPSELEGGSANDPRGNASPKASPYSEDGRAKSLVAGSRASSDIVEGTAPPSTHGQPPRSSLPSALRSTNHTGKKNALQPPKATTTALRSFDNNNKGGQKGDDESSVVSLPARAKRLKSRNPKSVARNLIKSLRRKPHDSSSPTPPGPPPTPSVPGELARSAQASRVGKAVNFDLDPGRSSARREGRLSKLWVQKSDKPRPLVNEDSLPEESPGGRERLETRKSFIRRQALDVKSLTMGLDLESANFLDWQAQAKCQEWLRSLSRRDPRANIKTFFDDVARDGVDSIEQEDGFHPELLSPLLAMFQRSSVFSVWRPTSTDSIRKMMKGEGTGKGLDIKGKSAKKGKLSAYVPFVQIHEDKHKKKIRSLPRCGGIRIFYKKYQARDNAHKILSQILEDMVEKTNTTFACLLESEKISKNDFAQDDDSIAQHVLASFHSLNMKDLLSEEEKEQVAIVTEWTMKNPSITVIDDYIPKCYGLDLPKRLFWEAYVMRAKDITRVPGSVYDTGRPSQPSFQDMNFGSIKDECEEPRAVVWQYTDPYLPPSEPDPDPMMPQTLLMAYEEHGRVMPVVSDFDCFMLGTRGVRFQTPLPEEQVKLVHNMLGDIENILKDCREGKTKNWTQSWINSMKHHKKHVTMPQYGFGDPKSYAIMKYAVQRLQESGAVRHGAECFNFYFPQELDDQFLVIGGNLGGAKYKYMTPNELQNFLSDCIDKGFTFPLNPKWILCDAGWKALWDKLNNSTHPNVRLSLNAWYPPSSGLCERMKEIHERYPEGFQSDLSGRKKEDGAMVLADLILERYERIQRAKLKLWAVMIFISIWRKNKTHVQAHKRNSLIQRKHVSFDVVSSMLSSSSLASTEPAELTGPHAKETILNMGEAKAVNTNKGKSSSFVVKSPSVGSAGSVGSDYEDEKGSIEVIDSVLNSDLPLSEYQTNGLTTIRGQFVSKSCSSRVNNRVSRRHTSFNPSFPSFVLEDVPLFILREYGGDGGVKDGGSKMFKAHVKKLIKVQRFMKAGKFGSTLQRGNEHFLPVEWTSMSKESKENLAEKLSFSALSGWDYNIIDVAKLCDGSPLLFIGWAILGAPHAQQAMARDLAKDADPPTSGYSFVTEFNVQMPILCSFLRRVEADYLSNSYHNSTHAADVLQTLNTMLQLGGKDYASSLLDIYSILVAAVIHDVKHPGLNNAFQINSRSDLAILYNDVSILENCSITWLFTKLLGPTRDFTVDIFDGLTHEQFCKVRRIIIRSVLETDMTHHFDLLKRMGIHHTLLKCKDAKAWSEPYTTEGVNHDPSMDMLCFLLHQADISNPTKPYPLFVEWADNILEESFLQGDKEAALSLPVSFLCDRIATDKKQSQIGFIKFVVQPSYQLLGEIIPLFAETVFPYIEKSLEFWDTYEQDNSKATG